MRIPINRTYVPSSSHQVRGVHTRSEISNRLTDFERRGQELLRRNLTAQGFMDALRRSGMLTRNEYNHHIDRTISNTQERSRLKDRFSELIDHAFNNLLHNYNHSVDRQYWYRGEPQHLHGREIGAEYRVDSGETDFNRTLDISFWEDQGIRRQPRHNLQQILRTLPTKSFETRRDPDTCTVCMEKFDLQETIRPLPCQHAFHPECIDPWLGQQANCPNCRQGVE